MVSQTFHQVYPQELVHDGYLLEWTIIVELCVSIKEILGRSDSDFRCATFRFDIGVIPALGATATRCRDRKLRDQAIELLLGAAGFREGIWDAVSAGMIAAWERDIEDEFMDENGNIPGSRRAQISNPDLDLQERMAVVTAKQ
jgi:hypothetical protein